MQEKCSGQGLLIESSAQLSEHVGESARKRFVVIVPSTKEDWHLQLRKYSAGEARTSKRDVEL